MGSSHPAEGIDTIASPRRVNPLLIACGVILLISICICLILGGASVGLLAYFAGEPEGLQVEYQLPYITRIGEEFDFVLILRNVGTAPFTVDDIDLDMALSGSILDGAIVLSSDPIMERDYSIPGIKTYFFNRTIAPGDTETVVFTLEAVAIGEFGGSVGVYVGDESVIVEPVITVTE